MSASPPVRRISLVVRRLLLLALVGATAAGAAPQPRLVASNRDEVRFSLELPAVAWRAGIGADPAVPVWDADLPGYVALGTPGSVRLPRAGGWLVVPPGTTPRLEVVREDWTALDARRLAIEPVPVMRGDPDSGDCFEQPVIPRPGETLPEGRIPPLVLEAMKTRDPALVAGPAVRLGDIAWWRGRRIVSYTVYPVRASEDGVARQALAGGEWRVRFVPDAAAGKDAPAGAAERLGGKGDERFAGTFLNGGILKGLPTEGSARDSRPLKSARPAAKGTPLGYPEVRVPVRRTQLHRVRASELVAAGLIPDVPLQESQIRLYQRRYVPEFDDPADDQAVPYLEVEVPIHMVGEGDTFDGDDLFLFWGLRPRDDGAFTYAAGGTQYDLAAINDRLEIANVDNIYWLQLADPDEGESWARMGQIGLPGSQGAPEATYRRVDYYNEALAYREYLPAITMDRYYFNTQNDYEARTGLSFWSPVPDQVGAVLEAGISGFSETDRTLLLDIVADQAVVAALPNFVISTRYERVYDTILPAAALTTPGVSLRVRNSITVLGVFSFLDWVRVTYDALYEAPFGRLLFPGGEPLTVNNLEIPGFTTDDIGLIETTDPRNPVFIALTRSNLVADGDGYLLSLQVDQSAGRRQFYTAARMTSTGVPDITYNEATLAVDPVVPTERAEGSADVLVVVHPEFREQAEAWMAYRRSRAASLTFQAVEPQDLYDWYSGGLKDPYAIKYFVNHALNSPDWGSWALVLIGDANENPRQLGVTGEGRNWSRDWVPTHHHVQTASSDLPPEVLASDKWYANPDAGESQFPNSTTEPPDLYVGRIPCNSPADLARILTKVQQVEDPADQGDWRRRLVVMADDAWSTGTLNLEGFIMSFQLSETQFEASQLTLADAWQNNGGMVSLSPDTMLLRPFMEPYYPAQGETWTWSQAKEDCAASGATPALLAHLNRGALIAHFQGHANHWLITHEQWLWDIRIGSGRQDITLLTNTGRPWVFFGMGCHLGDFIQHAGRATSLVEPGFGEKLLFYTPAGASAVYASSGYEFLSTNKSLSELTFDRLMMDPPHLTAAGETVPSRWLLGEVMWATEADLLAASQNSFIRQMVYQYAILGDPLMVLDCGDPEVDAVLEGPGGGAIAGPIDLTALDASNQRTVTLRARDEAGIDRLAVLDSAGDDLTADTTVEDPYYENGNRQIIDYVLTLPVRPFDHDLLVHVYDSADRTPTDQHAVLTLHVPQDVTVVTAADGEVVDPQVFVFTIDEPVAMEMTVAGSAWFDEATTVALASDQLELAAVSWSVVDNHTLRVAFTATASGSKAERSVDLTISGFPTNVLLEAGEQPPATMAISKLVNYPNPMRDETRFLFETGLHGGRGSVRVWTVSGRLVAEVPFGLAGDGQEIVAWDGRDREGDHLANGTYLYRVEVESGAGQVRSDMQRLVIMR
ncbi:MAG TPA: C25 family cysteine peptidase [Candidatus Krumholzibacteria bacterium]|nr:C25 family cysteine peptidase [Candidatus Krumholzibacteria bacterium]HPD71068.1 C25 family cysteine peptidase [Candidatus Krumholzibacteria bacterium]HRY39232.1 C25 family cysteine peptidase [Candidatus Krumholzibacteria bacterium]